MVPLRTWLVTGKGDSALQVAANVEAAFSASVSHAPKKARVVRHSCHAKQIYPLLMPNGDLHAAGMRIATKQPHLKKLMHGGGP